MTKKIFAFICVLWLLSVNAAQAVRFDANDSVAEPAKVKGIQFSSAENADGKGSMAQQRLFSGISVSFDAAGAVMAAISPWGQFEGALRVGIKNKFFPIAEVGWGLSDHTSEATEMHYKTNAPYYRVGCDYNFIKNPNSKSRLLGGVRYAFSSFDFDLDGPPVIDPIYGTETPFCFRALESKMHWAEVVFGVQTRIWKCIHLGWSVRYKFRLSETHPEVGSAWYVPGYGKNGGSCLGGTFNVVIDV